jgi:hypothetical protein
MPILFALGLMALHGAAAEPSFSNEIVPLLTRLGCNQGACHGKNAGQNGFRLSLRGFAPDADYASMTREFAGRRTNPAAPEQSLLLTKPSGLARHEGGKLFDSSSKEYRLLQDWIRAGAPRSGVNEPQLTRIAMTPPMQTLSAGGETTLTVQAQFSDGEVRDVTFLSKFDVNDASIALVDSAGRVRALRSGETAVRAAFLGEVTCTIITVPYPNKVPPERFADRNNAIDDAVFSKLQALGIEPSDLSNDETFVRRVHLDVIGMLPTPEQYRSFMSDNRPDKRARLIEELLNQPEFVDFWTLQWSDLFQNRKERDHDVRGSKGVRRFHEWLRRQVADNRPWDALVRDVLTAQGSSASNPAVGYFIVTVGEHREAHMSEVAASVAQAVLGTRIGCAQCHNHPLERYTQDDYYHFAAFFSRIRLERKEPLQGDTQLRIADSQQKERPVGVSQPRTGRFLAPQPLDRVAIDIAAHEDPRQKLSTWATDAKNEYFTGAIVNRLWKHFFSVGLIEPVDDLRATNPPSNAEAYAVLKRHLVQSKFDLKSVMRLILNSRTYQLDSATKEGNKHDDRFNSHYLTRRLQAEVLCDAVSQAVGVPEQFAGYPLGLRAVQLPDPAVGSDFLAYWGRSKRVTACACERENEITMSHLLVMMNSESLQQRILSPDGRVRKLIAQKAPTDQIIEELFLASVCRKPSKQESEAIRRYLDERKGNVLELAVDIIWALTNTKGFLFNH